MIDNDMILFFLTEITNLIRLGIIELPFPSPQNYKRNCTSNSSIHGCSTPSISSLPPISSPFRIQRLHAQIPILSHQLLPLLLSLLQTLLTKQLIPNHGGQAHLNRQPLRHPDLRRSGFAVVGIVMPAFIPRLSGRRRAQHRRHNGVVLLAVRGRAEHGGYFCCGGRYAGLWLSIVSFGNGRSGS